MERATLAVILLVAAVSAAPLGAQETPRPRFELGLVGNNTPFTELGDRSWNTIGLYGDFMLSDRWVVSPSVSGIIWGDGGFHAGHFRADVRRLFRGTDASGPYLFGSGSTFIRRANEYVDALDEYAIGAGLGWRLPLADGFAVSLESRYDHWLGRGEGTFGLALRIGIPFGRW